MGKLVKIIGMGVGLAAEAIEARKKSPAPNGTRTNQQTVASSSRDIPGDAPPAYSEKVVELPNEYADQLIRTGQAESLESPAGEAPEYEYTKHSVSQTQEAVSPLDADEEEWALDEVAEEVEAPDAKAAGKRYGVDATPTIESLGAMVMARCLAPPIPTPRLPCPVILPQRRPGENDRGFIRAYAPVLENHGIPEEAFLLFLKNLHTASQASPILTVVSVSAGIVGFVPSVAAQITSTVVSVAVGAAIVLQKRQRTNSFLDQMNDALFEPRGLYALVMTNRTSLGTSGRAIEAQPLDVTIVTNGSPQGASGSAVQAQQLDVTTIVAKREARPVGYSYQTAFRNPSSGVTGRGIELPEAAPLVFPAIDRMDQSQKTGKWKKSMKFIADYNDRRAQATYNAKNPDSKLIDPNRKPSFAAKLADPNHPAYKGGLLTLVSGGLIPGDGRGRGGGRGLGGRGFGGRGSEKDVKQELKQMVKNKVKEKLPSRFMKDNVLYLMIVNMPTAEEMHQAAVTNTEPRGVV